MAVAISLIMVLAGFARVTLFSDTDGADDALTRALGVLKAGEHS